MRCFRPILLVALAAALGVPLARADEAAYLPLEYQGAPASDLISDGRPLNPSEADERARKGLDLSLLDPDSSTGLWRNAPAPAEDALALDSSTEVRYASDVASRLGNYRFVARQGGRGFVFLLSKTAHDVLLRKSLLRALGYPVPAVVHVPRIRVRFASSLEKELFLKNLGDQVIADPARWVVDGDESSAVLQDVLALEDQSERYNFALGFVPASVIQNRRALNALIVPYSLVELPESVNLFAWRAGWTVNHRARLAYPAADPFSCQFEDARWITRRILRLTRADFERIVAEARLPSPVDRVVVEKLVARRNTLRSLFELPGDDLRFESSLTVGTDLVKGKLTRQDWPGYATRFAFGDPSSPLSSHELGRFFLSGAISAAIANLVEAFNQYVIPQTDVQGPLFQHQVEELLKAGSTAKIPFGAWGMPYAGGRLVLGRNIVAGSYLGTDNLIQLVDAVGYSLKAGGFLSLDGIPAPLEVSGHAEAVVSRIFSHVRPVQSMREALRTPFKNIIVPLLAHRQADSLTKLADGSLQTLPEDEREKRVSELLAIFGKSFGVGESLIITDSVGAGIGASVGASLLPYVSGSIGLDANARVVSRLHIHRATHHLFHVYKDAGDAGGLSISAGVSALIPVLTLSAAGDRGKIGTEFYTLDLSASKPGFQDNVAGLADVIRDFSLERVAARQKPVLLTQKFRQSGQSARFLFLQLDRLKTVSRFELTHPTGVKKELVRFDLGTSRGLNFEAAVSDALSGLLHGFGLGNTAPGSPGDTFAGKQAVRELTLDAEVAGAELRDPVFRLSYQYKGWSIGRKAAQKIVSSLEKRFHFDFFPETIFQDTKKIGLYSLEADLLVYPAGIERALDPSVALPRHLEKLREKARRAALKHDWPKYVGALGRYLSEAEKKLSFDGMAKLVGGERNLYLSARIAGFKKGDENGDQVFYSNSLGEVGSSRATGAVDWYRARTGMLGGEFMGTWLLRRL